MGRRTRKKPSGGVIASVESGSIAARLDLRVGDRLLRINGKVLRDIIDYRYECAEEALRLQVQRGDSRFSVLVNKEIDDDLGISFELAVFDNIIECHNRCSFCFIHQMARGLRHSLYIMDDDYRLSFLQGNFVTLTNMTPADWKRVKQDHLSPLNVSVHATNPELRAEMIKHPDGGRIMAHLRRLRRHGIDFNAQIVFCPGLNDGAELDRTIGDLARLVPSLLSIAIVPIGLTQFRKYLPQMTPVSKELARATIQQVRQWQTRFQAEFGDPIVRLGDEFYLIAELPLPGHRHYGDYDQLGDGVGGAALIAHEFKRLSRKLPSALTSSRRVTVITGEAGERVLQPFVTRLNQIEALTVRLRVVPSLFWGGIITVTGLVTGEDLLRELRDEDLGDAVIVSRVMLKDGTDLTLDGKRISELAEALGVPIHAVENSATGLIAGVLGEPESHWALSERLYGNAYEPNLPLAALN